MAHAHPYDMLISSSLLGIGIGLAFAALGNLIVQAVPPSQTGVATGMNTVMRTLGGALGGQLAATFIVDHQAHGLPTVTGFNETFLMATGVPRRVRARRAARPGSPAERPIAGARAAACDQRSAARGQHGRELNRTA